MHKGPRVTPFLVVILILAFAAELAAGVVGSETALLPYGALKTRGWILGDIWRLATYWVLHLNATHLVLNSAALLWLGLIVERRAGAWWMMRVFTVGALAAGAFGMLLGPYVESTGIAVGASGAIFAVLTIAVSIAWRSAREADRRLRVPLSCVLALGLAAAALPGVSMIGHLGGMLGGGALCGPLLRSMRAQAAPRHEG